MDISENETLEQLFIQAAKTNIHECAVIFENERVYSMSYSELINQSNCISSVLRRNSLFKELVVCISRPHLLIPSMILGILQANCSFCFADLKNVPDFLQTLQKYISVKVMLCEWNILKNLEIHNFDWNETDEISLEYGKLVLLHIFMKRDIKLDKRILLGGNNNSLCSGCAYVIQTSGTTGEPKVVQVPHRAIVPNILHLRSLFQVSSKDKIIQLSPLTFDPSIVEIFLALTCGASLVIIPQEVKAMPKYLAKTICKHNITIMQATPTLVNSFGTDLLNSTLLCKESSLRILALGGETCPSTGVLQKWQSPGNSTKFYNLYGITEVSCWATCHEITREELQGPDYSVPLGKCLSETVVKLLDDNGMEVSAGEGELFVGGIKRQCFINGNNREYSENMKPTGDWVQRSAEGNFIYLGRRDNLVKHNGKRVNITMFENALQKLNFVDSCSVLYHQNDRKLYIFVVCIHSRTSDDEIGARIVEYLRKLSTDVPLQVLLIPFLPQTSHRKMDYRALLDYVACEKRKKNKICSADSAIEKLCTLWKKYTGIEFLPEHSQFIPDGGDSVTAIQIASEIEWEIGNDCPLLVDKLLNTDFKNVSDYLSLISGSSSSYVNKNSDDNRPLKRTSNYEHDGKKHRQNESFKLNIESTSSTQDVSSTVKTRESRSFHISNNMTCFKQFSRRGQLVNCFCSECPFNAYSFTATVKMPLFSAVYQKELWKYNLAKCIDASPLVTKYKDGRILVFIGSHSSCFAAINLQTGEAIWELILNDRIESSACISKCGQYVVVGCYDYYIYCMNIVTGKLCWKIQTSGEVKSSPISDAFNNIFYCGSHDKFLYAIIADTGVILWKTKIGNGSIFSSPSVNKNPHYVIGASLDGMLACLNPGSGSIVWKFNCGKPIFSSPLALDFGICVGCVNNSVYFCNYQGENIWTAVADGPIFSSPSYLGMTGMKNGDFIVIGSHSGFVYCIEIASGNIVWRFKASSSVYSTPCNFIIQDRCNEKEIETLYFIAIASTNGTLYILNATNGKEMYNHSLPGEVFSSPVVCDNYLLIGCRNNYVYCYDLLALLQK